LRYDWIKPKQVAQAFQDLTRLGQEANGAKAEESLEAIQYANTGKALNIPLTTHFIKPFKGTKVTGDTNSPDLDEFLEQVNLQVAMQGLLKSQHLMFLRSALAGTAFQELRAFFVNHPYADNTEVSTLLIARFTD